jgi:hypothetical protein
LIVEPRQRRQRALAASLGGLQRGHNGSRQSLWVFRRDERGVFAVHHGLRDAPDGRGDDRHLERHGLEHRTREPLTAGRKHEEIGGTEQVRNIGPSAQERDSLPEAEFPDESTEGSGVVALTTGHDQAGAGEFGSHQLHGTEQDVEPFGILMAGHSEQQAVTGGGTEHPPSVGRPLRGTPPESLRVAATRNNIHP